MLHLFLLRIVKRTLGLVCAKFIVFSQFWAQPGAEVVEPIAYHCYLPTHR
ncbi:MAG: hypothetical protein HC881_01920 [Leptolyngbyaceae cyanobacterium SL_7_1]|nr:hypothetical protein [Leptolyngbyaceae cyanobacterium SL_7_1]